MTWVYMGSYGVIIKVYYLLNEVVHQQEPNMNRAKQFPKWSLCSKIGIKWEIASRLSISQVRHYEKKGMENLQYENGESF